LLAGFDNINDTVDKKVHDDILNLTSNFMICLHSLYVLLDFSILCETNRLVDYDFMAPVWLSQ